MGFELTLNANDETILDIQREQAIDAVPGNSQLILDRIQLLKQGGLQNIADLEKERLSSDPRSKPLGI